MNLMVVVENTMTSRCQAENLTSCIGTRNLESTKFMGPPKKKVVEIIATNIIWNFMLQVNSTQMCTYTHQYRDS